MCRFDYLLGELSITFMARCNGDFSPTKMRQLQACLIAGSVPPAAISSFVSTRFANVWLFSQLIAAAVATSHCR